ncbi:hypothetical protein [Rosistilla oblonga]|uniref:hypothetical protein n=1 Tax=Rosistilla oblonga TaxID=2527990 RepID=UPI003A984E49
MNTSVETQANRIESLQLYILKSIKLRNKLRSENGTLTSVRFEWESGLSIDCHPHGVGIAVIDSKRRQFIGGSYDEGAEMVTLTLDLPSALEEFDCDSNAESVVAKAVVANYRELAE